MNQCQVCQKDATRRCGGCQKVYYCARQHQKEDWSRHKHVCRVFKVCANEDQGSCLVATRNLNPGDFVLQEPPLIWGPSFTTIPVCLGCGKSLDDKSRPCLKCGWPVCDDLCEKSPGHLPECKYTTQRGERVTVKKFGLPQPIYRCITVLRCLYHKQFLPKSWKKFEKLKSCKIKGDWTKTAEFVRRFFKLYGTFSVEEVLEVCGIILVNSHEVAITEPPSVAIYGTASSIEHSCSANCAITFTNFGDIYVTCAKPIKEGDHLSISKVDPLLGTSNRRYHLYENRFFWCQCRRCEDPTEFGTNFSTLKCQNMDCEGCLLPASFTDLKKLPDWVCDECAQSVSSYLVHDILERVEKDLEDLDKSSVEDCRSFLATYRGYLHENHFCRVKVKYILCQILMAETCTDEDLVLKMQYCQDLEDLLRRVAPAEKRVLGKVLFEKFGAVAEFGRRSGQDNCLNESKILMDVVQLLKNEPEVFLEGKIWKNAVEKLREIEKVN